MCVSVSGGPGLVPEKRVWPVNNSNTVSSTLLSPRDPKDAAQRTPHTNSYGLDVHPPQMPMLKSYPPVGWCQVVRPLGADAVMRVGPHDGVSTLIKETPGSCLAPPTREVTARRHPLRTSTSIFTRI